MRSLEKLIKEIHSKIPNMKEVKMSKKTKLIKNTKITSIARENTREFLNQNAHTQEIVVDFIKLDSTPRTMIMKLGVEHNLKGGENKVERLDRSYMTVFDTQKKKYRTLNLSTLTHITINGETLTVV